MCLVLHVAAALQAHISIAVHANNQHVHIIEAAHAIIRMQLLLLLYQILYGLPGIEDIPGRTPHGGCGGLDPLMGLIRSPGTGAEEDITAAVFQGKPHAPVQVLPMNDRAVIAVIIFQEIHAPLRECLRIDELMLKASRITGAGQVPGAGIHAEFQPLAVHIIRNSLHAIGEFPRIRHKPFFFIPLTQGPAVVDDQIFIAHPGKPCFHHRIRCLKNQFFIDVLSKGIP